MISKDFSLQYIIQFVLIAAEEIVMLAIPAYLSQAFEVQTNQRNVPDQQRRNFHNWLQYYLDFCSPIEGTCFSCPRGPNLAM